MINVGLVGFGLSGRYLQAPFFQTHAEFNLKSIVTSRNIDKSLFPETRQANNIDDLISDNDINLISICSPSSTHYEYALKCLKAGKHILIEKPITATVSEAQEIFELASKKKLHVFVYQNRRFDSDFLTVQNVIKSGLLGKILSYEAHFDRYKPILNPKKWKEIIAPANGIIYDLGAHLIDQAICLFGKPKQINGSVYTQREGSDIDDAFDIYLDYHNVKVTLRSSLMVKNQGPKYIIHGTKGSFTKFGLDIQEDHLVENKWPLSHGFGRESPNYDGQITTNFEGLEIKGKIETHTGSWMSIFDNIANVILRNETKFFEDHQIIEQIKIIVVVKK